MSPPPGEAKAARDYAARGWPVFPAYPIRAGRCACGPGCDPKNAGKHPIGRLVPRGFQHATTDPATIAAWWSGTWHDANIGIVTGGVNGLIVLDVDPRHGGDDSLADLERRHGRLPDTPRVSTGGGGLHMYFRHPGGSVACSAGAVGRGLDVRGHGGYVVAPPSLHVSSRRYAWAIGYAPDDVPLAPAPAWLLALVTASSGRRLCSDSEPLVITDGHRNDRLMRLGAALRRYGVGEAALRECLTAINHHHAQPPLGEGEVRQIAASVARYAPQMCGERRRVTTKVV